METKRKLYNGAYRNELEDEIITQPDEPTVDGTTSDDGLTPEEKTFKQRYGDLRSHSLSQNERIKSLENQLSAAQKQEIKIPSSKEEIQRFAQAYPDVYRHIRTIAMTELLQERENLTIETSQIKEDLNKVKMERGLAAILQAHPDFEELDNSPVFKEWIQVQPEQIQDWCFNSSDPQLCIKALDLFKVETNFKQKRGPGRPSKGADLAVNARNAAIDLSQDGGKKIWKASEIGNLKPKDFMKFEDEIEQARIEGRIDMSA